MGDLPVKQVRKLLSGLAKAHLIETAPGTTGRWRMDDLVHLYAQRLSDAQAEANGREQARDRLLGYYLDMAAAAQKHFVLPADLLLPREFTGRNDALGWFDVERSSLVAAVSMAQTRAGIRSRCAYL